MNTWPRCACGRLAAPAVDTRSTIPTCLQCMSGRPTSEQRLMMSKKAIAGRVPENIVGREVAASLRMVDEYEESDVVRLLSALDRRPDGSKVHGA